MKDNRTRASFSHGPRLLTSLLLVCGCLIHLFWEPVAAEMRTVTASGEYRVGDRDTRKDGISLATEAAKKNALEQVATYLESVTEVKDLNVTRDEIRTYTAGMVLVINQQVNFRYEGQTLVIHVDLTAQIDPAEVAQAIAALRQNQDAQRELTALRAEVDQLQQQVDATNQALATAASPDRVQALIQQRQQLFDQVQSDALLSQAWTDWALVTPTVGVTPWVGLWQVRGLVAQAARLTPRSPHIQVVQQVINQTAVPPGMPASPPMSPQQPRTQQPASPAHGGQPPSMNGAMPAPHQPPLARVVPSPSPHSLPPSLRHYHQLPPTLHQIHPSPHPHVARMPFRLPHHPAEVRRVGGHRR